MTSRLDEANAQSTNRDDWLIWLTLAFDVALHAGLFFVLLVVLGPTIGESSLLNLFLVVPVVASAAVFAVFITRWVNRRAEARRMARLQQETAVLRTGNQRAKALQAMASTMRAALSFVPVVEAALDVCSLALEEMGVPPRDIVGAVFLFRDDDLQPIAHRNFEDEDLAKGLAGQLGLVGGALSQAEPVAMHAPAQDPELAGFATFAQCQTAICIPLRAGFQIFGTVLLGSRARVRLSDDHLDLFNAVADQAVIALQNAQLYQALEDEKDSIVEAEEETRRKLARDLHDGPTQSIATIAMRINFIRALMLREPRQAMAELQKVEELAKETSKEIRGMLFTLRPLVLETQGLSAAIETTMSRMNESDGLNFKLVGGEHGDLLDERAQGVVFYIVEEALGNARKHAQADTIEVRLWRESDLFVTRISDDGVGFDTRSVIQDYSKRGSLGMVNMKERAALIDGSLRLESAPGRGTRITLVVPLSKHGRSDDGSRMNGDGF